MKKLLFTLLTILLPMVANADATIDGIYEVQPTSYRTYNGNTVSYSSLEYNDIFTIKITDNLDGTYHVDDLFGGYYCQGKGYGPSYSMRGNIIIAEDGTVSLIDSSVLGWGDSLVELFGTYDAGHSSFTVEAEYVQGMKFSQTWVKIGPISQGPAFSNEGINYRIGENNTVSVISKRLKYSGDIVIPNKVNYLGVSYDVTSIGNEAFSNCTDLTSVVIPNSVINIGSNAFYGCTCLSTISIPNSVTRIVGGAFQGCTGLTSIIIPGSLEIIESAFSYCTGLTSVTIQEGVKHISSGAFEGCSSLKSISIPNSVETIEMAFIGCTALTTITIPYGVTSIAGAFDGCSGLTNVSLPNSVTDIGGAFWGCTGLTSISIPNSVTSIGSAFYGCTGLTSIIIPNSVTSISGAFQGCTGLSSIIIPNSVMEIGWSTFKGCTGLTSVIIPNSVNSIGDHAFEGCMGLKDIYCYADNVPRTSQNAFDGSNINNATLRVKANCIDAYKVVEPWNKFWKIVALNQCAKPTIQYANGKLHFSCETENVSFESTITDTDIKSYTSNDIELSVTYTINVYAQKTCFENSDVATATLCWIDADPSTEGVTDGIANINAKAVLIQTTGNTLSISGAEEGTPISIYDISGRIVGTATAATENTNIPTSLKPGDIGLVKIGEKTIKIIMK